MKDEVVQKQPNNITSVSQYGPHSAYIAHAENAITNVFTNQNSDNFDENGHPLTPLVPSTQYISEMKKLSFRLNLNQKNC